MSLCPREAYHKFYLHCPSDVKLEGAIEIPFKLYWVEMFRFNRIGLWCSPIGPKFAYRNSESIGKFEFRLRLPSIYRMSEEWVYAREKPIINFIFTAQVMSSLKAILRSCSNFMVVEMFRFNRIGLWCSPIGPKFAYRNSESIGKFEFRLRDRKSVV